MSKIPRRSSLVKQVDDQFVISIFDGDLDYYLFDLRLRTWKKHAFASAGLAANREWVDWLRLKDGRTILLADDAIFFFDVATGHLTPLDHDIKFTNPRFSRVIADRQNNLWIGSINVGLFKLSLENGQLQHYSTEFNSDLNAALYTWITDLHEDGQGRIWIRLARSYAVYDPDKDSLTTFSLANYANKSFKYIRNFTEDLDGNVWIGSEDRGVGKTKASKLDKGVVAFLTADDGLISNNISQIEFADDGLLWILSDLGIDLYNSQTGEVHRATWSRGIPKSQRFLFLPDRQVALVLSGGGIAIFSDDLIKSQQDPPKPYLTTLQIRDRFVYQGNKLDLENINVLTNRDYLSFEFSALGFQNPKEFSYRLVGVDGDWIETTARQTASYTNLRPGEYKFELKARLTGAQWSEVKTININLGATLVGDRLV